MAIREKGTGVMNSNRRFTDTDMLAGIRRVIARRGVEETRFSMILAALRHENRAELERVTSRASRPGKRLKLPECYQSCAGPRQCGSSRIPKST